MLSNGLLTAIPYGREGTGQQLAFLALTSKAKLANKVVET